MADIDQHKKEWRQRYGTYCPGCGHEDIQHVAGFCYYNFGSYCGWSPLPDGWKNYNAK